MKQIFILVIFFVITNSAFSQDSFQSSYFLQKSAIIYVGVNNPILFQTNVPFSQVSFSLDNNGELVKERLNAYLIRVNKEGAYTLKIKDNKTSEINTYTLQAKRLPIPQAHILNHFSDTITRLELKDIKKLELKYVPAVDFYITATVINFTFLKISSDGKRKLFHNEGAKLSPMIFEILLKAKKDDILIFKDIQAIEVSKEIIKIPDLILFVKD